MNSYRQFQSTPSPYPSAGEHQLLTLPKHAPLSEVGAPGYGFSKSLPFKLLITEAIKEPSFSRGFPHLPGSKRRKNDGKTTEKRRKNDGKTTSEAVHKFKTAEAFAEFQAKNDDYLRIKMELVKTAESEPVPDQEVGATLEIESPSSDGELPESDELLADAEAPEAEAPIANAEAAAELASKRDELIETYKFDPELQYNLQYEKTAFYARSAQ